MSVVKPEIDGLLERTEQNPFLLSTIAAKRARDINNMVRSVANRAENSEDVPMSVLNEAVRLAGKSSVTKAMEEINNGTIGYDKEALDAELRDDEEICF